MKWGKRNGPPYPLNYDDLSEDERKNAKEKAIRDGNVVEASNNRKHYTDQELRQTADRYELNTRVSRLAASHIKTGEQKVKEVTSKLETTTKFANASISLYNLAAKAANSFGEDWVIIGEKKQKEEEHNIKNAELDSLISHPDRYSNKQIEEFKKRVKALQEIEKYRDNRDMDPEKDKD